MTIIGNALMNLEKQYPGKPPKKIIRNVRRTLKKPLVQRSRADRKYLLSFAIAIFEVLLPDDVLDAISKVIEPKIRKRLLNVRMLLLSLIVYHLSPEIKSYNDLIRELTIRLKHRLPKGVNAIVSKASFTYQLTHRSPKIFQTILIHLLNQIVEHPTVFEDRRVRDRYTVKAMDYSVFNLSPSLEKEFKTAKGKSGGKGKVQCRAHMVFDTVRKVVESLSVTDARMNEKKNFNTLFKPFLNQPDIIWVCDLGYWAFWIMDDIMDHKHHFVFRLREKATYTIVETLDGEAQDYLVILGTKHNSKSPVTRHLVRLVACPQEGSDLYFYVTSLTDPKAFSAQDIRSLYRSRWSIELFFKDLKHVLDFKPASKNANGIEIEFYGALITHLFVKMVILDAAEEHHLPPDDLSFSETYQTVNSWIRRKHKIFSDAPIEKVREEYETLLAFIAHNCISETAKKRSARERQLLLKAA